MLIFHFYLFHLKVTITDQFNYSILDIKNFKAIEEEKVNNQNIYFKIKY